MADFDCDVAIVGAGISGNLVAARLAAHGLQVVILEAGPGPGQRLDHLNTFYAGGWPYPDPPKAPHTFPPGPDWRDPTKAYEIQRGPLAFGSGYERMAGGTTQHWLGTAMRLLPHDFQLASHYGVAGAADWPLSYGDLEPWYGEAEAELGVSGDSDAWRSYLGAKRSRDYPMPAIPQSYLDQQLASSLDGNPIEGQQLDVMSTPQARNSIGYADRPACMGNTSCVPICPINAKYDATVHLTQALRAGASAGGRNAELRTESVVHRVEVDAETQSVSAVHYKTWDGTDHRLTASIFVLAAHAVETPKILLMSTRGDGSAVANSSGEVGNNLMDHVCLVAWGTTAKPVHPYRGPLSTSGIGNFRDGDFRRDHAAFRIEIGNDGWSWPVLGQPASTVADLLAQDPPPFGAALRSAVADGVSRQLRIALELEGLPIGEQASVRPSADHRDALGLPRPELRFDLAEYTRKGFPHAQRVADSIFAAFGVTPRTVVDEDAPGYFEFENVGYQYRGAGHIIGTTRMGQDPKSSVVNADLQSHDHPNLFMLGSGVFPSTGTANPTLTIAALALRAAKTILARLS